MCRVQKVIRFIIVAISSLLATVPSSMGVVIVIIVLVVLVVRIGLIVLVVVLVVMTSRIPRHLERMYPADKARC